MRHPERVRRLILASTFYTRDGLPSAFWEMVHAAEFSMMPQVYKDEFLRINNDPAALLNMHDKDVQRMRAITDWKKEDVGAIRAPALIVIGDQELVLPEHALEMYRLLPRGQAGDPAGDAWQLYG